MNLIQIYAFAQVASGLFQLQSIFFVFLMNCMG